jgi:hypothetical protein
MSICRSRIYLDDASAFTGQAFKDYILNSHLFYLFLELWLGIIVLLDHQPDKCIRMMRIDQAHRAAAPSSAR